MDINDIIEKGPHTELSWRVLLDHIDELEDEELRHKFFEFIGYLNYELKELLEVKEEVNKVSMAADVVISNLIYEVDLSMLVNLPGIHERENGTITIEEYSFLPREVDEITPRKEVKIKMGSREDNREQTCMVRLNSGTEMRLIGSKENIAAYINKLR